MKKMIALCGALMIALTFGQVAKAQEITEEQMEKVMPMVMELMSKAMSVMADGKITDEERATYVAACKDTQDKIIADLNVSDVSSIVKDCEETLVNLEKGALFQSKLQGFMGKLVVALQNASKDGVISQSELSPLAEECAQLQEEMEQAHRELNTGTTARYTCRDIGREVKKFARKAKVELEGEFKVPSSASAVDDSMDMDMDADETDEAEDTTSESNEDFWGDDGFWGEEGNPEAQN